MWIVTQLCLLFLLTTELQCLKEKQTSCPTPKSRQEGYKWGKSNIKWRRISFLPLSFVLTWLDQHGNWQRTHKLIWSWLSSEFQFKIGWEATILHIVSFIVSCWYDTCRRSRFFYMQPVDLNPSVTVVQTAGIPVSQEFKGLWIKGFTFSPKLIFFTLLHLQLKLIS